MMQPDAKLWQSWTNRNEIRWKISKLNDLHRGQFTPLCYTGVHKKKKTFRQLSILKYITVAFYLNSILPVVLIHILTFPQLSHF